MRGAQRKSHMWRQAERWNRKKNSKRRNQSRRGGRRNCALQVKWESDSQKTQGVEQVNFMSVERNWAALWLEDAVICRTTAIDIQKDLPLTISPPALRRLLKKLQKYLHRQGLDKLPNYRWISNSRGVWLQQDKRLRRVSERLAQLDGRRQDNATWATGHTLNYTPSGVYLPDP